MLAMKLNTTQRVRGARVNNSQLKDTQRINSVLQHIFCAPTIDTKIPACPQALTLSPMPE